MDRLVIESILADLDEIVLSSDQARPEFNPSIILTFKAVHADQVKHAFTALNELTSDKKVEFMICRTLVSGIYDLEIKTDALDEPIRIVNKAISPELLLQIEDLLEKNNPIRIGTNVTGEGDWIIASNAQVKECSVKEG
ncbi:hypothetical protein ACSBL2_05235 [Pedobacter sp. AW31-3R]|uniref:hypothetical protein n=1 Tax=Pedobacter sp. AW31-3R TaxID=3445781 RepID=UPI003FA00DC1